MKLPVLLTLSLVLLSFPAAPADEVRPEAEPNDDMGAAQTVPPNADVAGIAADGDNDWYRFELPEPTWVRITISGAAGANFSLVLYDPDGNELLWRDGQPTGKGEELVRRVRRGFTYLKVLCAGAPADTKYALRLRVVDLLKYEPTMAEIKAAIRKGLAWLSGRQKEAGEWESEVSIHGVTGLALMAFAGEALPEFEGSAAKATSFLTKGYVAPGTHADAPDWEAYIAGCFVDPNSTHLLYEQAIAVLALVERLPQVKDAKLAEMVKEGVALLVRSQNAAGKPASLGGPVDEKNEQFGGWRYQPSGVTSDLSASGWCLIALTAAAKAGIAVPESVKKDYMSYCRRCFDEERGLYAYQPGAGNITYTTNAVGCLTTLLCRGGDCPVIRTGLQSLKRNLPGWEEEGGPGKYPFYYWYYASRAMYVAGGNWWKEWEAVVCPMLLEHQNADGSWDAAGEEEEVGTAYTTAVAILILQLCAGNPPAYLEGMKIEDISYPCPQLVDDIEALLKAAAQDERSKDQLIREVLEMIKRYRGD